MYFNYNSSRVLTQKQKRPKFVVDVKGLACMPKFQIESISEIALSDRVVKVESRISGLHSTVMQHILDVEVEMASLRKSLHSANNIEVAPPSGTTKSAQDNPNSSKPFSDASVSGPENVRESQLGNNDPVRILDLHILDLHILDQSMQASSVDLPRPIDMSTTVFDSTVVTKLNVHGVETLIGEDGKTYDLPVKVNLNQSRSRDKDGVVVNCDDASVERNFIVKSYGDALKTSIRHCTKSHVVFGNSNSIVMKGVFHAAVSGVDSTLTEDDLKNFLTGKHIVFNGVKCYSKDHSLSKTFKVSLSPSQYKWLHNPKLYGVLALLLHAFSRGIQNNFCIRV